MSASVRDDAQTFPDSGHRKGKATVEYIVTNEDGRSTGEVIVRCTAYGNDKIIDDQVSVDLKTTRLKEQSKALAKIAEMTIRIISTSDTTGEEGQGEVK